MAEGKTGKLKFLNTIGDKVYAGIVLSKPDGNCDGKFNVNY